MKKEKFHWAFKPTIGGAGVPHTKMINDLGEHAVHYVGTFAEYNPVAIGSVHINRSMNIVAVVKKSRSTILPQRDFSARGFLIEDYGGYHSDDFNCNGGIIFTKQNLLQLANAMDETDTLLITVPDTIDKDKFLEDIEDSIT